VQNATLAPSGGNVQPWHFYWGDERLWVTHDPGRSRNLLDGSFHATYLALGAAVENVVIAAAQRGLATDVETFPRADDATVAAELRFGPVQETEHPALADLARLMPLVAERQTNRKLGPRVPLTDEEAAALLAAAAERGGSLELCTDPVGLEEVGRIIGVSDRVRMLCPGTHRELVGELRWTGEEAERTRDGVTLTSLELSPGGEVGVTLMTRPDVAGFLRELVGGKRLEEAAWDSVAAASAMGLLSLDSDSRETWIAGGRAMQRMWLEATALGLAMQPMTVVLYQFEMLAGESASVYTDTEVTMLRALEERLYRVFRRPHGAAALLFRLAHVGEEAERSLRLPAEWVLSAGVPPGYSSALSGEA
jgi:nitroreductase